MTLNVQCGQMHLIKVPVDLEHGALFMGVVAPLSKRTVSLPCEAPTVLSLVFLAQDVHSLPDVELIVRVPFCLTMGILTVRGTF